MSIIPGFLRISWKDSKEFHLHIALQNKKSMQLLLKKITNNNQWSLEKTILAGMRMTISQGAFKDKKRFENVKWIWS